MNYDLPIACSLSAGEQAERLAEIGAIGKEALHGVAPNGVLRFRSDQATRQRLESVVVAESACCPFLTLELTEANDELLLSIAGPGEAEPLVRELIDAIAGA